MEREKNFLKKAGHGRRVFLFCLLIVIFLAGLPTLISTPLVTQWLVRQLNQQLPGQLQLAAFTIGWQTPMSALSVYYQDPQAGIQFRLSKIQGSDHFLDFLVTPRHLGHFRLFSPTVHYQKNTQPLLPALSGHAEPANQTKVTAALNRERGAIPFWDTLLFSWESESIQLQITGPSAAGTSAWLESTLFSGSLATGTVNFEMRWREKQARGQLGLKGYVNLPTRLNRFPETLVAKSTFQFQALAIANWLAFTGYSPHWFTLGPAVRLNGELGVSLRGIERMTATGELHINALDNVSQLVGHSLKDLESFKLALSIEYGAKQGIRLSRFDCQSAQGQFRFQGQMTQGQFQFNGAFTPVLLAMPNDTAARLQFEGEGQRKRVGIDESEVYKGTAQLTAPLPMLSHRLPVANRLPSYLLRGQHPAKVLLTLNPATTSNAANIRYQLAVAALITEEPLFSDQGVFPVTSTQLSSLIWGGLDGARNH